MTHIFRVHTFRCKHGSEELDEDYIKTALSWRKIIQCQRKIITGFDAHSTQDMLHRAEILSKYQLQNY